MKNNKIVLINEEGMEVEFEPLFTFDSDETKKSYIVYTNHEKDNDGKEKDGKWRFCSKDCR